MYSPTDTQWWTQDDALVTVSAVYVFFRFIYNNTGSFITTQERSMREEGRQSVEADKRLYREDTYLFLQYWALLLGMIVFVVTKKLDV